MYILIMKQSTCYIYSIHVGCDLTISNPYSIEEKTSNTHSTCTVHVLCVFDTGIINYLIVNNTGTCTCILIISYDVIQ